MVGINPISPFDSGINPSPAPSFTDGLPEPFVRWLADTVGLTKVGLDQARHTIQTSVVSTTIPADGALLSFYTYAIPANTLIPGTGQQTPVIELKIAGTFQNGNTKTITIVLGGSTIFTNAGQAGTGGFIGRFLIYPTGTGAQIVSGIFILNGVAAVISTTTTAIDMTAAQSLIVKGQVNTTSADITMKIIELLVGVSAS